MTLYPPADALYHFSSEYGGAVRCGKYILPGMTIGILGGGQLGQMLGRVARQYGYKLAVMDPDPEAPAMQIADHPIVAPYDDDEGLKNLGNRADAITVEFENVAEKSLLYLANHSKAVIAPGPDAFRISRNRFREKSLARSLGLPVPDFALIEKPDDLIAFVLHLRSKSGSCNILLKTCEGGYDGKGQKRLHFPNDLFNESRSSDSADQIPEKLRNFCTEAIESKTWIAEERIEFILEASIVAARYHDGSFRHFPILFNEHRNGILQRTVCRTNGDFILPEDHPETILRNHQISVDKIEHQAAQMVRRIAETLQYTGTIAVEFFILDRSEGLYFNEIAPRPHNSGHLTIEAFASSQFDQQLRALCGLPPGEVLPRGSAVMINLIASDTDQVADGFPGICQLSDSHFHLYGKKSTRPGRKMGHITVIGRTGKEAYEKAERAFSSFQWKKAL